MRAFTPPVAAFPAHWAPVDVMFYTGNQFPAKYRGGAFIAFHGSWNRAPMPQDGYNVTFQPFSGGKPSGNFEVFANGFAGKAPLMNPNDAVARADGVAQAPDGSLLHLRQPEGQDLARDVQEVAQAFPEVVQAFSGSSAGLPEVVQAFRPA